MLVFYVIVWLHRDSVLVSESIAYIRRYVLLLTSYRLLTPSNIARLRLPLYLLRWFRKGGSSPDSRRLVHLLLLLELIVILALGLLIVEATSRPAGSVNGHRCLDRVALLRILRVLRLQSRHVSILFSANADRDRGFTLFNGQSFFC